MEILEIYDCLVAFVGSNGSASLAFGPSYYCFGCDIALEAANALRTHTTLPR